MTRPPRTHPRRLGAILLLLAVTLAACGSPSGSPTPALSASPTALPTPSPSPTPLPTPARTPVPTPSPRAFDEELLHRRLTVLVAGEDQSAAREAAGYTGTNTDALMVVSISPNQSQIVMLSLPRDTVDVPLADGRIYHGKINAIMSVFGLATLKGAVSDLLDVPIDAYVKIDMDDLVTLVDAVGGVDVDVPSWVVDAHLKLSVPPGPAHLDGQTALSYTRTRFDTDYGRAARQQQVVLALVRAYADPATVWSLPDLLASLRALDTDLDLAKLPTYLAIAKRSVNAAVSATVLQPPRFSLFVGIEPGTTRGWVMIPNVAAMRAYAHELISD